MKKFIVLVLVLSLMFAFAACSDSTPENNGTSTDGNSADTNDLNTSTTAPTADGASLGLSLDTGMKEKLDQLEYAAYVDLFYNQNEGDYADKKFTKDGVFASIEDAFNNVTRYYVWGYADTTKCCDFQWEFVMPDGVDVPENGSYVTMSGTLTKSDSALDGFWFTDVELKVTDAFKDTGFDIDMTTMSPTLARVQIANMQSFTDNFDGKTVRVYGRALSMNTIQHPYYDNSWSMDFKCDNTPDFSIGDDIVLTGAFTKSGDGSYIEGNSIVKIG